MVKGKRRASLNNDEWFLKKAKRKLKGGVALIKKIKESRKTGNERRIVFSFFIKDTTRPDRIINEKRYPRPLINGFLRWLIQAFKSKSKCPV